MVGSYLIFLTWRYYHAAIDIILKNVYHHESVPPLKLPPKILAENLRKLDVKYWMYFTLYIQGGVDSPYIQGGIDYASKVV